MEDNETTCDRPDNLYTTSSAHARSPVGERLDYLMFRANAGEFSASKILVLFHSCGSDLFWFSIFLQELLYMSLQLHSQAVDILF